MEERAKIDISVATIIKLVVVLFSIYLLYLIRDVVVLLFVVFILVSSLGPIVNSWSKRIGKPLSILSISLIFIGLLVGFIYLIVPPFINETGQLVANFPSYLEKLSALKGQLPSLNSTFANISQSLGGITGNFFAITAILFGGISSFIMMVILTIYFLADEKILSKLAAYVIPPDKREDVIQISQKISEKVGNWVRGQLLLCLVMGIIAFIGLSLIGVKYALTLAVLTALLEFVPIIGPLISGAVAALIALTTVSPLAAVIVVAFFILASQAENSFLVPKIMQKAVGLPPAIIIIAILIGSKLIGIFGALLAVPISGIVYVLIQEWQTIRKVLSK